MWDVGHDEPDREWNEIETPFSANLYDVVSTTEGPYAVGGGGLLVANLAKKSEKPDWNVELDDGPNASNNRLKGLDVTDDGERIWFTGSSGALGCYDVTERRKYDYSYPKEMTSTWEGIAVCGDAGAEKVLVANGSGEILPFMIEGFDVDWGVPSKPETGKAASIAALAASPDGLGYAVDTSGNAFVTTDEDGWENIGILQAQVKFHDIHAGKNGNVYVAGGDGKLYRYDDSYKSWTPIGVANDPLRAVDVYKREDGQKAMVVMGDSGTIYQRIGEERWESIHSPTRTNLNDLTLGYPDVAVGSGGTVLQRPRSEAKLDEGSPDGDRFDGRGETDDGDGNVPGEQPTQSSSSSDNTDSTSGSQTTTNDETSN